MKATAVLPAVLLGTVLAAGPAPAQFFPCPPRQAPDTCNQPGFYNFNTCGMLYGPSYYLQPPFPPFNGLLPVPTGFAGGCVPAFRDPNAARYGPLGLYGPGTGYGPGVPGMGAVPGGPGMPYGRMPGMGLGNPLMAGGPNMTPGCPPGAGPGCQPMGFPTHPFAHGPRDFFMECDSKDDHY